MDAWDPTWKHHHLPMWAKKSLRKNAIKRNEWNPCYTSAYSLIPYEIFDHWGSVNRDGIRALVAQPYHNCDDQAAKFAEDHGWTVKSSHPGPWAEGTWLYEFLPKDLPIVPAVEVVRLKAQVERLKQRVKNAWYEGHAIATRNYLSSDKIDAEVVKEQLNQWEASRAKRLSEGEL